MAASAVNRVQHRYPGHIDRPGPGLYRMADKALADDEMTLPIRWTPTEPAFDAALRFTLWSEGGLSDDPKDRGGRTNWGITHLTYDTWRFMRKLPLRPVDLMTREEMRAIYLENYWTAGTCQPMPAKLGIAHFDWCVNHGPSGAKRMLQAVLGVKVDGSVGQRTLEAINARSDVVAAYIQARREWYHDAVDRDESQGRFLTGWLNRVDNLEEYLK